jgi:hypothetical protein
MNNRNSLMKYRRNNVKIEQCLRISMDLIKIAAIEIGIIFAIVDMGQLTFGLMCAKTMMGW